MDVEDDKAYKKSVRNMSIVLAAIVITIFAALGYGFLNPVHDNFQSSVSEATGQDFTLHLTVNTTRISTTGSVNISAWVISTNPSIHNVTAADGWGVSRDGLWTRICTFGFPIGVGVMQGHYDSSNYTFGAIMRLNFPLASCPFPVGNPSWFAFEPQTSNAIVSLGGTLGHWSIATTYSFSAGSLSPSLGRLVPGVYTAVAADEWGDVLLTNFRVE